MHYYKRNIGDYHKKAGRLSMLEHGAYTLLIDSCYDRERFPTLEDAIEWTWARSEEEIAAVKFVLGKFFTLVDGVYVQQRIQDELDKYHENSSINARIARDREEARRTNRARTVDEPPPNQEPITKNHKPETNIKYSDEFESFWKAYPEKTGKGAAYTSWKKLNPPLQNVLKSLEWQKTTDKWKGGFIPNPATYLNQRRWEDENPKSSVSTADFMRKMSNYD